MPSFDSNDPREFGWEYPIRDVVPYSFAGHPFYNGLSARLVPVFNLALARIQREAGFQFHSGLGINDGDWGYEDRPVKGGSTKSFHAFAGALDVNAPWNPYLANPPERSIYRLPVNTSQLVEPFGLLWGGGERWGSRRDWMHIENHNSPAEAALYASRPIPPTPGPVPFPLPAGYYYGPLSGPRQSISGVPDSDRPYRAGLVQAQQRLGVAGDGRYGPVTAAATVRWQTDHRIGADGLIGPITWRTFWAR